MPLYCALRTDDSKLSQVPGDTLAQLQKEKENVEAEYSKARKDTKQAAFDRDIADKKGQKKSLEDEAGRLQSQLEQVSHLHWALKI